MGQAMRRLLFLLLAGGLTLGACGGGGGGDGEPAPATPHLVIEPDDGRGPIIAAIAGATDNIRLTIYEITDLQSVPQNPPAPPDSIVRALVEKSRRGVPVRMIVDQNQYNNGSSAQAIQQTVAVLRTAGVAVRLSSTAFCYTHQKTFVIDGPTAADPGLQGTAIVMSLNLMPGYFGATRDYAVITRDPAIVREATRVFDSDFALVDPKEACSPAHLATETYPPPYPSDTPSLAAPDLVWSPVSSKGKLLQLIGRARKSLTLATEELGDNEMVCRIQAVAMSAGGPEVRILLSGDTGSNASAVKTLLGLNLPNLSIRIMPGQSTPAIPVPVPTPLYMHGKQVIVDGVEAFVGSENLTNTSLTQNRELGVLFSEPRMIARLQGVFDADFTNGNSLPAAACPGPGTCATIPCATTP